MAIFSNIQHLINGVDIDTLLSQIEELTNELKKEKAESCKSISTLSSKLERAQKMNDTLKEDFTRETNKCHIAESKLAESESRIVSLAKENNELLKTEEKLKADLQKLGVSNSSLNGKNLTLHNKVTKLEDQIQQLKDEINAKDSKISSVNKNAERLENRLKNETSLLDEAKNLVETLNEDNQQLKAEISRKTEENTIISSEVENLKKINQELNADREDKLQRISVLEKDIKEIQDTFESVTCDNNRLQQNCKTISSDNQELKSKNDELSNRFTSLNSDFESLKTENDRICSELELQKTVLEQANAENTQLKNDLLTVQNEFTSAQEQLDVYGKNLDYLQSQIQILNSEKEELKPYMYLIDAKKEEEAKERALNLAKGSLQELVDKANSVLTDLKHDEVSTILSFAISTAQELVDSANDITVIDDAKLNLDNSINQAQLKEQELIEEELRKIKEEEEAEERALNLAKDTLQALIDKANGVLSDLKHEEVSAPLSLAISIAQELIDSVKDITVIDDAKQDLDNSVNQAQLKEQQLIEEEQRKLKEEEEAKELALNQAKETLQELIDNAGDVLSELKHDEVSTLLSSAISTAQGQMSSAIDIADIDEAKHELDKSINLAQSKEANLLEEEHREQQEKEASENAAKLLSETRNALTRLIDEAKKYKETIEYADIATGLQYVIESVEKFSEVNSDNIQEIQSNILSLKTALSNAKNDVTSEKKTQSHVVKRSILEIFDTKEGDIIESEKFFKRPEHELVRWRRIFEESILYAEHRFICTNCRQDVKISGRKYERGLVAFFSHLHDSDFCEIKTTTGLSKEQIEARKYGLIAESERHKRLKKLIHEALEGYSSRQKGINNVVEEKRVNSDIPYLNWRRPDVMADYNGMHLVFELQLSTTFVSVVVQRDIFYRLNDYFIIWVFNFDDNEKYVDLTNLMCKDIYYANKRNVFIFDKDAQRESEERGELVLKCNWLDIDNTWHYSNAKGNGDGVLITLDQLKFDQETCKPYYFDAETPYYEIHPSVKERILKEERSKQQMLDNLQARAKREAEESIIKRDAALKDMVEKNETVIPFKEGNRYGFKYNNVVLVPAKYSSYSSFGENGMFKVSFNRHYGLIDKYGNELFACNYLDFHRLSNGIIVAESTTGFYMHSVGYLCERSPHDSISLKVLSPEISVITHNSYELEVFIIDDELVFKRDDRSFSFYSLDGKKITEHTYSQYKFSEKYSCIWVKDSETELWQIVELNGTPRNDKSYHECTFGSNIILAMSKGQSDIYDIHGNICKCTDYDSINKFEIDGYYRVTRESSFGLMNERYEEIIPTDFSKIKLLDSHIIAQKENKWGIFDVSGTNLTGLNFDNIRSFTDYQYYGSKWLQVSKDNLIGLYNDKNESILPVEFNSIKYVNGCLIAEKEGKYYLYNCEGNILINNSFDDIQGIYSGSNFKCCTSNKWQLFNAEESSLLNAKYDSISAFNEQFVKIEDEGKYGLMSMQGDICVPIVYDDIDQFVVSTGRYSRISSDSIFKCKDNDKYGAFSIDEGKLVIPTIFDSVEWWNNNVSKVMQSSKWGLYEHSKGLLTEIKYSSISSFNETKIQVSVESNYKVTEGHISPDGKEIPSEVIALEEGLTTNKFFGKWGVLKGSSIIVPYELDSAAESFGQGLLKVKIGDKVGLKNLDNEWVFRPSFRDIYGIIGSKYVIVKLIKYRRERKYTWGRSYHMVDVEYNEFQLYSIDGSQKGIPTEYVSSQAKIEFVNASFVCYNNRILCLKNFKCSEGTHYSIRPINNDAFVIATKSAYDSKFGLLDANLQEIIPFEYSSIEAFSSTLFLATKKIVEHNGWWNTTTREEKYLFKSNGKECSIGAINTIKSFVDGKAEVTTIWGNTVGFIDENGDVIPEEESVINNEIKLLYSFGNIEIRKISGDIIVPISHKIDSVELLTDGYYLIRKWNKYGIVGTDGLLVDCDYDSIQNWSDGIVLVKTTRYSDDDDDDRREFNNYKLLSLTGFHVSEYEYSEISSIENGEAIATRNGVSGRLNSKGEEICDTTECIKENIFKHKKFGKWYVTNVLGEEILPARFSKIELFEDKFIIAVVQSSNSYPYSLSNSYLYDLKGNEKLSFGFRSITTCSNGFYIISNGSRCALYSDNLDEIIPFDKGYTSISEWANNKFVATKIESSYYSSVKYSVIISALGDVISKQYSEIGPLQDGKAQIVLYNQKGYINDECVEIAEAETQGEWTIKCFLGNYSVWKGEEQVLFDLVEASFFSPTVIKLKKKNVRYYNLYSLQMESGLSSSYIDISDLSDGQAIAVNINKLSGTIDTNGIEIYDEESSLSDNILVKRKFSRYDIFVDQNEVISGVLEVSLWATNRLKVKNEYSKYQIYSIEDNTYIGESFSNIYDIQEGKAKVLRNGSTAYIDINANILPEMSLSIGNNHIKKKIFGYWTLVDNNNNSIIEGEYREIGTYKGRFIKFDGSDFRVLDKKYPKPIPVIGTFYRQYTSTLIYLVGGHYVRIQIKNLELNGKSVTEYTKEHSTLKLIINYINFKKQAVYGVPYKEMNPKTFVPFEDNQEIEGKIYKVLPFGIKIKFPDGRLTLIHKNRLAEIGYQDVLFTIGQSITIVKKGYDDEHKADIWDIIQIK